ncbi:MAG: prtP, partial [Paenibacillaceae bacterium]|nr:prtP [Paenibacillaceae bacterium]
TRLRPVFAAVTALCLLSSAFTGPGSANAEAQPAAGGNDVGTSQRNKLVELQVNAAADTVARAKAEQYNNANNISKNINNVEQVVQALGPNGLKTKALRNFIMINWFYNPGVTSIDDPANAGNAYLQAMRGADNDFYTRYSDSMFLVFKFNSTANSQLVLGPDGKNFAELEKGMKVILEGIKRRNAKVKYIECGNEFDLDIPFQGAARANLADYMKMYKAFSNAVKHVNSLGLPGEPLQLGGPTLAQFSEMLLAGFLDEAKANDYQVDFISWHHYRPDSLAFREQTEIVKRLLDERSLDIPMVMSEYGFVGGGTDYNPSKELLAKNAAFMTDAAYQMSMGSAGHPIMPMTWVTSHDTAYFKNEFLTGYQLSGGTTGSEGYVIDQPSARQYLYLQGVGDTAPGETVANNRGKPFLGIKEIKLYDEAGELIPIAPGSVSARNTSGAYEATHAVTDGNDDTFWDGRDTVVAVESKVALRIDLGAHAPTVKKIAVKWHNVGDSSAMPTYRFRAYGSNDNIVIYDYLGHTSFTPFFHTLRMQSLLGDTLLATEGGSKEATGVRVMATRNSNDKVTLMVWNTQLDGTEPFDVKVNVDHLPAGFTGKNVHIKRYLVDETHSNVQQTRDDSLQLVTDSVQEQNGRVSLDFTLERNAVSFIELAATDEKPLPLVLAHDFSNGEYPVNWVLGGNGSVVNNAANGYLRAVLADGQTIQPTFGYTGWKDYAVEVKVRSSDNITLGEGFNPSLLIRGHGATARNNAYRFRLVGSGKARVQKVTNGSAVTAKEAALPASIKLQPQTWYTLRVEVSGNQFKFYVNGLLALDYTDAAMGDFAQGNVGLMAGNVNTDFTDIKVFHAPPKLTDIKVNGITLDGFDSKLNVYTVKLPAGTASAVITAQASADGSVSLPNGGAVDLTAAAGGYVKVVLAPGTASGEPVNPYTLYLHAQSPDASLAAAKFSAGADPVLEAGKTEYTVSLPAGTQGLSVLKAMPAGAEYGAVAEVLQKPQLQDGAGTAVIRVTAENGTVQEYTFRLEAREAAPRGADIYRETFEDGALNGGWSPQAITQFRIDEEESGGRYAYRDVNANNILIANSNAVAGDADITVRVKAVDPLSYPGLAARISDNDKNLYMLRIKPNESKVSLGKIINDSLKEPGNLTVSMPIDTNKWYQLRLVLKGDQIKAYMDDDLLFDVTDGAGVFDTAFTPLPSGKTGIRIANARAGFDDLLVTGISQVNTAPVITLNGAAEMTVAQGSNFNDPGAAAYDAEDGVLTAAIVRTGEVDTAILGTYTVRYNVADSAGLAATEITRTVQVVPAPESYLLEAKEPLLRNGGLEAAVTVKRNSAAPGHEGMEVIYFQLMKGDIPVSFTAVEQDLDQETELSALFDAADPDNSAYTVRVFVLDRLLSDLASLPEALSNLLVLE